MQQYQNVLQDKFGNVIVGASVAVYVYGTTTPATIYSGNGTGLLPSNTVTTSSLGEFAFYAANGRYSLSITATNFVAESYSDFILYDPADIGAVTASSVAFTPFGTVAATNVQNAIQEVVTDLSASSGSSLVGFVLPNVGASATTVQDFLRAPNFGSSTFSYGYSFNYGSAASVSATFINSTSTTTRLLDVINLAGQGLGSGSCPEPFVVHSYTETPAVCSFDNVGTSNSILVLQNGNNPTRRADKPANFVGTGQFLVCNNYVVGTGYVTGFVIDKDCNIVSQNNANFYGTTHSFGYNTTATTTVNINGTAGTQKSLFFQDAGVNRIQQMLSGGILYFASYTAAGAFVDLSVSLDPTALGPFTVNRPLINTKQIQNQGKAFTANGSATTFTYPANTSYQYITTSAASLATTLPATAAFLDGLVITLVAGSSVATATWVAGIGGATITGAPASLTANTPVRMIYHHATTQWLPY